MSLGRLICVPAAAFFLLGTRLPADESGHEGHDHGAEVEKLGTVDFPVSCSEAARKAFPRAAALLHSFAYGRAEQAFQEIVATDPSCAMGYWGVAMTRFHPIWAAGNPVAEPTAEDLRVGADAVRRAKASPLPTPRERDYVEGVEAYYKDAATLDHPARSAAFAEAMERLHQRQPQDREATIFYALALLGTALPTDKTYVTQRKAAEILNAVLPEAPDHPGVAHYLIHSMDYPPLAELGLPAARAYAKIAPSAPHALHMPSHVFTRLGLWDESIDSNIASAAAALRLVQKAHPGASSYDQLHALDYLEYAYLQTGRDADARRVAEEIGKVGALDVPQFAAAYALAAVPARYVLERRSWTEAAGLAVRPDSFPWSRFPQSEAMVHFARAVAFARSGNAAPARAALERLAELQKLVAQRKDAYWADQVEIQRRAAEAWVARQEGRNDEALALLRSAADLEDAGDKHAVTPGPVLPAREQLADLLEELGRSQAALEAFETVLKTSPGRYRSLLGAARTASRAGDRAKARAHYAALLAQCARSERPELSEARAFVAQAP